MSAPRRGSVALRRGFSLPTLGPLQRIDLMRVLTELVAQVALGGVGDQEIADVAFNKLISGTLSRPDDTDDPVELVFSGMKVVARSNDYVRDLRRFAGTFNRNDNLITASDTTFLFDSADVGRGITGDYLIANSTIAEVVSEHTIRVSAQGGTGPFPDVTGSFVIPARAVGRGWALGGDGILRVYAGEFGGTINIAGFAVAEDGTVVIGSGSSKMTANPDGTFTWGPNDGTGRRITISPDGTFYGGGLNFSGAIWSFNTAGQFLLRNLADLDHYISIGAIVNDIVAPKAVPAGGAFDTAIDVLLYCETQGTRIYYTTDGSAPTSSSTLYSPGSPIHLTADTTLKAVAFKLGEYGPVQTWSFTQANAGSGLTKVPNPIATPPGGTFAPSSGHVTVTISDSLAGASIRYTTDGTNPTTTTGTLISPANGSTPPSGTVSLSNNPILKMIAYKSGLTNSDVIAESYHITTGGGSGGGGGGGGGGGRFPVYQQ